MTQTSKDWRDAYNETDFALSRVEGLAIALEELVDSHLNHNDNASMAITALVKTINEKVAEVMCLRTAEYSALHAATSETPKAA